MTIIHQVINSLVCFSFSFPHIARNGCQDSSVLDLLLDIWTRFRGVRVDTDQAARQHQVVHAYRWITIISYIELVIHRRGFLQRRDARYRCRARFNMCVSSQGVSYCHRSGRVRMISFSACAASSRVRLVVSSPRSNLNCHCLFSAWLPLSYRGLCSSSFSHQTRRWRLPTSRFATNDCVDVGARVVDHRFALRSGAHACVTKPSLRCAVTLFVLTRSRCLVQQLYQVEQVDQGTPARSPTPCPWGVPVPDRWMLRIPASYAARSTNVVRVGVT